jgi:hypothetical protein
MKLLDDINAKKTVTSITIRGEENISLLFTAMCQVLESCTDDDIIGVVGAKPVRALCSRVRDRIGVDSVV